MPLTPGSSGGVYRPPHCPPKDSTRELRESAERVRSFQKKKTRRRDKTFAPPECVTRAVCRTRRPPALCKTGKLHTSTASSRKARNPLPGFPSSDTGARCTIRSSRGTARYTACCGTAVDYSLSAKPPGRRFFPRQAAKPADRFTCGRPCQPPGGTSRREAGRGHSSSPRCCKRLR